MTDVQQAVPVAQEDREAANKAFDLAFRGDTNGIDDAMAQLFADHRAPRCSDCPPVGYPTDKTRCTDCDRLASLPCKSGDGTDHGLGPHATVVDDCEDGFMSVAIVVGENVYLAQGGEQITMSREQFAEIAKTSTDATQTREAEGRERIERAVYQDAPDSNPRDKHRSVAWDYASEHSRARAYRIADAALNARGGA